MRLVKPTGEAERATQTTLDTIEITPKMAASWKAPPFQREFRMNPRVMLVAEEIAATGVIPGVITLGVLDSQIYIVDGQHRLNAFQHADIVLAYADVRTHFFKTMAAMSKEYVLLNSALNRMRPDDILKGEEEGNVHLQKIRKLCPYVGYDAVRRGGNTPVLSMSTVLRCWNGSRPDVPTNGGVGAAMVAAELDTTDTTVLCEFLALAFTAWRRDPEYWPLWGSLNLVLCMWLYRRVVIGAAGTGLSRSKKLDVDQFRRGLTALSADKGYIEYLVGRRLCERDRVPAYNRMKAIFAQRYAEDTKQKLLLPQPAWAHSR